ncbi:MAG: xanthine dehydrogenase family protein subunit M [Pyrinomonadaceae bacterium]
MRSYIPHYQLVTPATLADAIALLGNEPGVWKPFAGGTDLMVLLEAGKLPHLNYLNITQLRELQGIEATDEWLTIGALTTYTDIQNNGVLQEEFPMLCQAASETGGLAIQNRGTLGGNIINASPAADSPPALLAYDAQIELTSINGSRWIDYSSFHIGYKQMMIAREELLTRIRTPRPSRPQIHYYRKVGTRKAQAISKVCLAATATVVARQIKTVRIAFGSVAPIPLRCFKTESVIRGAAVDNNVVAAAKAELAREMSPIDDIRSTKQYRLSVSQNLLADFLASISQRGE